MNTNVPEHIVFCIDTSIDGAMVLNRGSNQDSRVSVTKMLIKRFMVLKQRMAPSSVRHKFAVTSFVGSTVWNCDLTEDLDSALKAVDDVEETIHSDAWDANSLFDDLTARAPTDPASHTLRVVLVYFRAQSLPVVDKARTDAFSKLPGAFPDIFQHDKANDPATKESVQRVFDKLNEFTDSEDSYILETAIHYRFVSYFARLLAHPLQRTVNGWLDIDPEASNPMDVEK
ncbi:Component of the BRCA1-A complex [Chytriomyces hyalinus]|nr:Component of the BRCA1-A complex [Chytriomyces hyalinus]